MIIGCAVLSQLDDDEGRLLEWGAKCPYGGIGVFVAAWPISFLLVLHLKKKGES